MDVYVITYDIANDKRRAKVFETLESYGKHLQYSVFWCTLSKTKHARLVAALGKLIDDGEDQVLLCCLGPERGRAKRAVESLGRGFTPPAPGPVIV